MPKHWHNSGDKYSWANDVQEAADKILGIDRSNLPNLMRLTKSELMTLAIALQTIVEARDQ